MDLSIIIVSYNTKDLLRNTIKSVIDTVERISYEIIVVDNNSQDGSISMVKEEFPQVILIESGENLGFPKGNNLGIKRAKGRYILLLNSDTVVLHNTLDSCVEYMESNNHIGALGCKILLSSGKLDHACKRGFPTPEASFYYLLKLDKLFPKVKKFGEYRLSCIGEDDESEVDSLTGAFMMVSRKAIEKAGLLDESFFMYGEDLDWCYRIKEKGYKVFYYPKVSIIHYKGASSRKKRWKTLYEFHRAMIIFYNKHYRDKYNSLISLIVYIGIFLRLILALVLNLFKKGE